MFKNPITLWLKRTLFNKRIEKQCKEKSLQIGYMSIIYQCTFGKYNVIGDYASLSNVDIGDLSYVVAGTSIKNTSIGKFCSIGPECTIGLGRHPSSQFVSTHPAFFSPLKQAQISFVDESHFQEFENIEIGNDVWIGANVTIVDGVKIADGVIVAAGSVVTKDIPPYAIVGGVPAKVIRYRFEQEEIEKLLEIKWWDMDMAWLKEHHEAFFDIKNFKELA
jgi:acetyltransferase-like isoleucine patch superfamily enzyme